MSDIRHLLDETDRNETLLFGGIEFLPALGQARWAHGANHFPICSIIYSVPSLRYLPHYFSTLVFLTGQDSIVTNSSAGKKAVDELLDISARIVDERWSVRPRIDTQVANIPLGVDTNALQALDRRVSRKILGLPENAFVVLWVGRFSERYKADLEPLLRAASRLQKRHPDLHLLLAGKDDDERYASQLNKLACAEGVNTTFIRNFPFSMKPLIYSAADVFASPVDNIQETFGIAIAEAMSFGLPVVASDWDGYRDLVVNGVTGFLIPTYWGAPDGEFDPMIPLSKEMAIEHALAKATVLDVDALTQRLQLMAENPGLRRQFGEAGRRRAQTVLDWSVVIRQYGALWEDQMARHRSAHAGSPRAPKNSLYQVYGHYATQTIDSDFRLALSPDACAAGGKEEQRTPRSSFEQRLRSTLARYGSEGAPMSDLVVEPEDRAAVIALAKKGRLRMTPPNVAEPSPQPVQLVEAS